MNWKDFAILHEDGYFTLATEETGDVPVRSFLTPQLLEEVEDDFYKQIINATKIPGVKLVCMSRTKARQQLSQEVINAEYAKAGILVNDHGDVPLDEAGPCYKSSEEVIEAVVKAELATVQYRLCPLASLKGLK